MRILFDQGTPVGIRSVLGEHEVKTAHEQGWSALSNGDLLRAAEDAGFELFLTTDSNLAYQQNLRGRNLAIVILSQNKWKAIQLVLDDIANTVNRAKRGSFTVVEIPR